MILNLLLNTRLIWMIFTKTLKNTSQTRKAIYIYIYIFFDDIITDILSNKKT